MQVSSELIIKVFPDIGEELGYGAHGQVFTLKHSPDKVLKVSKLYDSIILDVNQAYKEVKEVYHYLMDNDYPCFAKVFNFDLIAKETRPTINGPQDYIIFYSVLEKLFPLEEDEKKVFKTICDKFNNNIEKNKPLAKILDELSAWLIFDRQKALAFWSALQSSPINHNDVHRRNIMKDANNNYKLVDFDKAKLVEINNDKGT